MERNRRPPDVEEALSSMLWTPYQRTPTDSSDEEDANVPKHRNKSKASTANSISNNNNDNNLYATAAAAASAATIDTNLFKPAIRYQSSFVSNHGRFMPKSYNSCNRQLPSYEHIEKERTFHSMTNGYGIGAGPIAACATNGIYLIPTYSTCTATTTTMVHSFTDNFIEYQVKPMFMTLFAHCPVEGEREREKFPQNKIVFASYLFIFLFYVGWRGTKKVHRVHVPSQRSMSAPDTMNHSFHLFFEKHFWFLGSKFYF